ncbi:MAG: mechanosensitive ion channel domain-containing protein [Arenicellales bacterium]
MNDLSRQSASALQQAASDLTASLPTLLGALALLLAGWLLAFLLKILTRRLAERGLDLLTRRKTLRARLQQSVAFQLFPKTLSQVVFWVIFVFFVAAAIQSLGLAAVSEVMARVTAYLPRVLGALVIFGAALWLSELGRAVVTRAMARTQAARAELVGRLAQVATVTVGLILAVDQLGVNSTLLVVVLVALFACTFGAGALAFGLGARDTVGNILGMHYFSNAYRTDDRIRIDGIEGRVVTKTTTNVTLETDEGLVTVPGHLFSTRTSVLLSPERSS